MKYIKHGFRMFSKNFLLNMLLSVQLLVTLMTLNFTIGQYNSQMDAIYQFENFAKLNGVYFMPNFERLEYHALDSENHDDNNLNETLLRNKLERVDTFEYIRQAALINECFPAEHPLEVVIYSDNLLNCCFPAMKKGDWLTQVDSTASGIPAVVVGGDINSNKFNFFSDQKSSCEISVIGKIAESSKMLSFATSGEGVTCLELYELYNNKYYQQPKIYVRYSDVKKYEQEFYHTQSSYFILFQKGITEQEKVNNIAVLKQYGYVKTFSELLISGSKQTQTYMRSFLSIAVCAIAIAIIGIISMTALNVIKNLKNFAILYLCGYKWNDVIKIILGYLVCIFISSLLMFALISAILIKADIIFEMQLLIKTNNLLYSIGTIFLITIVALIIPLIFIRHNSPLKAMRSWGE